MWTCLVLWLLAALCCTTAPWLSGFLCCAGFAVVMSEGK